MPKKMFDYTIKGHGTGAERLTENGFHISNSIIKKKLERLQDVESQLTQSQERVKELEENVLKNVNEAWRRATWCDCGNRYFDSFEMVLKRLITKPPLTDGGDQDAKTEL